MVTNSSKQTLNIWDHFQLIQMQVGNSITTVVLILDTHFACTKTGVATYSSPPS